MHASQPPHVHDRNKRSRYPTWKQSTLDFQVTKRSRIFSGVAAAVCSRPLRHLARLRADDDSFSLDRHADIGRRFAEDDEDPGRWICALFQQTPGTHRHTMEWTVSWAANH